jgi:hypothetical protein
VTDLSERAEQEMAEAWGRTAAGQKGMRMSLDFRQGFWAAREYSKQREEKLEEIVRACRSALICREALTPLFAEKMRQNDTTGEHGRWEDDGQDHDREMEEASVSDSQRARIEQEFENEQVRRMERTGRCPCCGSEQGSMS